MSETEPDQANHPLAAYDAAERGMREWEMSSFYRVYYTSSDGRLQTRVFSGRREAHEFANRKSFRYQNEAKCVKFTFSGDGAAEIAAVTGYQLFYWGKKTKAKGDS